MTTPFSRRRESRLYGHYLETLKDGLAPVVPLPVAPQPEPVYGWPDLMAVVDELHAELGWAEERARKALTSLAIALANWGSTDVAFRGVQRAWAVLSGGQS